MTDYGIEMMLIACYMAILSGLIGVLIAVTMMYYEWKKAIHKMNQEAEKNGEEL
jgi:hypothetical protein